MTIVGSRHTTRRNIQNARNVFILPEIMHSRCAIANRRSIPGSTAHILEFTILHSPYAEENYPGSFKSKENVKQQSPEADWPAPLSVLFEFLIIHYILII